jgi:hypothetical protein
MVNVKIYFTEVVSIDPASSLTRAAVARVVAASAGDELQP